MNPVFKRALIVATLHKQSQELIGRGIVCRCHNKAKAIDWANWAKVDEYDPPDWRPFCSNCMKPIPRKPILVLAGGGSDG